jgi:hypothetical protein
MDETRTGPSTQPITMDVIQLKAEAINALVESFEKRYEDGQFGSIEDGRIFLTTWRDAINDLVI